MTRQKSLDAIPCMKRMELKTKKNKSLMAIGALAVAAVALNATAGVVAYWPLAYENGVRTTTETVFANQGEGGTLNAVPSSRYGASWIQGSDYCPQGTNAFPVGYGIYDPVSGTNIAGETGLYFHKISLDGYAAALMPMLCVLA